MSEKKLWEWIKTVFSKDILKNRTVAISFGVVLIFVALGVVGMIAGEAAGTDAGDNDSDHGGNETIRPAASPTGFDDNFYEYLILQKTIFPFDEFVNDPYFEYSRNYPDNQFAYFEILFLAGGTGMAVFFLNRLGLNRKRKKIKEKKLPIYRKEDDSSKKD